ncbi:FtsK/SpoIIIE domain-containing protein [Bacillus spongiae]|uniref:FtsK/SpoIIIE domain-containing protein n=1 Tax=Bacillus spongiae TaxID=2683610 RepID=A0ABU8H8I0_9BACI
MIFEIASTVVMGGILGTTFYHQQGGGGNDHSKIENIAKNCGLVSKDGKAIRILRKSKHAGYTEYVYQIPQGLSFKDFKLKLDHFQDGLNAKKTVFDFSLSDIKEIDWKRNVLQQIRDIIEKKTKQRKSIEMEYDGALKIFVYETELTKKYVLDEVNLDKFSGWKVPVGMSRKGALIHDFEQRPHMIVAGATGFGKSEFIKMLITVLTHSQSDNARFHLIDLKGGLELGRFKNMRQVETFGRNPDEARIILDNIQADMSAKLDDLFAQGYKDIAEAGQKERYFVFIDEAADIADDKQCMAITTDIARRGRAAGYRLIYSTQYPTNETLPSQVRANIGARVCFRLETNVQSRAVLDEGGAEELPEIQGRAIFRRVSNHIVQTPYIERKTIEKVIGPNIVIKSRKEADYEHSSYKTPTKGGSDTLIVEETELS